MGKSRREEDKFNEEGDVEEEITSKQVEDEKETPTTKVRAVEDMEANENNV